jgi:hypothetical protein
MGELPAAGPECMSNLEWVRAMRELAGLYSAMPGDPARRMCVTGVQLLVSYLAYLGGIE